MIQLMEDGVSLTTGLSALLLAEQELRPRPEPAQALLVLTVELTAKEKAQRLKTAILRSVQVNFKLGFDLICS